MELKTATVLIVDDERMLLDTALIQFAGWKQPRQVPGRCVWVVVLVVDLVRPRQEQLHTVGCFPWQVDAVGSGHLLRTPFVRGSLGPALLFADRCGDCSLGRTAFLASSLSPEVAVGPPRSTGVLTFLLLRSMGLRRLTKGT